MSCYRTIYWEGGGLDVNTKWFQVIHIMMVGFLSNVRRTEINTVLNVVHIRMDFCIQWHVVVEEVPSLIHTILRMHFFEG